MFLSVCAISGQDMIATHAHVMRQDSDSIWKNEPMPYPELSRDIPGQHNIENLYLGYPRTRILTWKWDIQGYPSRDILGYPCWV